MDNFAYLIFMQAANRDLGESEQPMAPGLRREVSVRVGPAQVIPALLREFGVNPAEVLAEVGVAPALFNDPDKPMSFALRSRIIKHCVDRTACHHFGLLIGERGGLHSMGLVGLLVQHSPNVGSALRSLVRYLHHHVRGAVTTLAVSDHTAMLSYDVYEAQVEATDQLGDGAVAAMFNILRALCGPDWKPVEALFAHRRPNDVRPFKQFFRAPLRFDAEHNGVVFPVSWLQCPVAGADAELRGLLQKQMDALEAAHGGDLREEVRAVLRTALLAGHAKADQIAALFSMHSRTLNRRLNACGTSFQLLVDEGRFEIARQMLENTDVDIKQIAVILEYADASAFARAFRRWSGTTPSQWRDKVHSVN